MTQHFLVIARRFSNSEVDEITVVDRFIMDTDKSVSNRKAAQHYMKTTTPKQRRALGHENSLFECVSFGKWSF